VKGVGSVRFQLDSGGFLEVAEVLFIPEMTVNLLLVSALEIDGFGVAFYCGWVLLYPEGATPDTWQCCLVSGMRGCTGCWDNLWLVQWISGFRVCVGEWAGCTGERVDTGDSVLFQYSQRTQ
jgi:hypothetical protein